ncbi:MAG: PD40 domain-containing protein [Sedimentisphaerales bacterium]|nr:PD40 domain-containing protein [Sedimentisphaerales bacterium]
MNSLPRIRPDYSGVTLPPNIAPLNFLVEEEGTGCFVRISGAQGEPIEIFSKTHEIGIPQDRWHRLLESNRGGRLDIDVFVRSDADGASERWRRFATITNTIASEDIDGYLVYRRIRPGHSTWREMGIYQRDLRSFDERTILTNDHLEDWCLNCHAFCNHGTDTMSIAIRSGAYGSPAVLVEGERVSKVATKFGYTSWHPSGKVVAFSVNQVHQVFRSAASEIRDVFDCDSVMTYYRTDAKSLKTAPALARKDRLETYPAWSPDGRHLYFCSAPLTWEGLNAVPQRLEDVHYDLVRVSYDVDTDTWGQVETVLSAQEADRSLLLPRISPDGRWLLLTTCDYGCFPVYRSSSDLCLLDLDAFARTGRAELRRLDANSDASESWHSFSSNGRWIAFSSKRLSHIFTRTYLAYMDEEGRVHKPILLPQKDPRFYDSCLWTFSVPELVTEPIRASKVKLAQAVRSDKGISVTMPITMATPKANGTDHPWQSLRE